MGTDLTRIELDQFYPHPPAKVWRALTEPALMATWLMTAEDFAPRVGQRFTFRARPVAATGFSGTVACEVLEADEPKRLSYSWNDAGRDDPLGWLVTWELLPEGRGTRVLFTHSGFDPDSPTAQLSRTIMGSGWPRILTNLESALT
ncbi:SRPBCC family protein [Tenggerimyces flavus]|uniref:SRPBCC domain-containing protein n=1 Tax=Tenggerimyces flavus TaxID=1708749 RepID=A0ABV7YC63_9ACTN|nr:SRPBCC domain-containing protein [Tenggerimyces flavus]MBM7787016.1 uncharacterized protein YndB with AHSA1/START domain [Tenggerimyces flavus]